MGRDPSSAYEEAQRLLDADARADAAAWRKVVGVDAPVPHALSESASNATEAGDDDTAKEDGDYVLLLMQHDLQQMDGAQSSFEEALDTADEIIKEISPHAAVYDDWRKVHEKHAAATEAVGGKADAASDAANGTAGDTVLRLMEHDLVRLTKAENAWGQAITVMERVAREVKQHESLFNDFVKSIESHAKKSAKLSIGGKAMSLPELRNLVDSIRTSAASLAATADGAKHAEANGLVPIHQFKEQTGKLYTAAAMALLQLGQSSTLERPKRRRHASVEEQRLSEDVSSADEIVQSAKKSMLRLETSLDKI